MRVRGAPLIGATGAYGMALAMREDASDPGLDRACALLSATRPTAVNLQHALRRMSARLLPLPPPARADAAWREAAAYAEEDVELNRALGKHGAALLHRLHGETGRRLEVMTHCNAGWLATVDCGTALAPVYLAHDAGLPVHVWVSETRPRNQGLLTAWELRQHGIEHTVIVDNAAGHLLARGCVDLVIVGADRVSAHGDVCNKIGTYLKALAAGRHNVPFYAAVPGPTIDWELRDSSLIAIEERADDEVRRVAGWSMERRRAEVALLDAASAVFNPGFDVTPAQLVTGLITERGLCAASEVGLATLYPERRMA
jgi:methylthioribose-1-phosphate isomerase